MDRLLPSFWNGEILRNIRTRAFALLGEESAIQEIASSKLPDLILELKKKIAAIDEDTYKIDDNHEFLKNSLGVVLRGRDYVNDDGYTTKWRGVQIELNTNIEPLSGRLRTLTAWGNSYMDTIKWLNGNNKKERGPWWDSYRQWDWNQLPPTERVVLIKRVIEAANGLKSKNT